MVPFIIVSLGPLLILALEMQLKLDQLFVFLTMYRSSLSIEFILLEYIEAQFRFDLQVGFVCSSLFSQVTDFTAVLSDAGAIYLFHLENPFPASKEEDQANLLL